MVYNIKILISHVDCPQPSWQIFILSRKACYSGSSVNREIQFINSISNLKIIDMIEKDITKCITCNKNIINKLMNTIDYLNNWYIMILTNRALL